MFHRQLFPFLPFLGPENETTGGKDSIPKVGNRDPILNPPLLKGVIISFIETFRILILIFKAFKEDRFEFESNRDSRISLWFQSDKIKLSYCQGDCRSELTRKIGIRRRQLKLRGPLVVGKLHASVYQFTPDELKKLNGFNSVLHELKIDGQFVDPWEKAVLSR